MYKFFDKIIKFGLVGVAGTSTHYLILILLVEEINIDPVIATTFGFIFGAMVNYLLNYHYTFKSTINHFSAGTKFFIIAFATGALNSFLVNLGVHVAEMNYLIVQILSTIVVFFVNFILNIIWTFRVTNT